VNKTIDYSVRNDKVTERALQRLGKATIEEMVFRRFLKQVTAWRRRSDVLRQSGPQPVSPASQLLILITWMTVWIS